MFLEMMPAVFASRSARLMDVFRLGLGAEIIYSFVVIVCCLMIYLGTKEIYELSSHKGIEYFRKSFLFFALAYFFRSFIKIIFAYFEVSRIFDVCPRCFHLRVSMAALFIFVYFSSMAVFYLLYSVLWKKRKRQIKSTFLLHVAALFLSGLILVFRSPLVYVIINIMLLIFVFFTFFISRNKSKSRNKKHSLHTIYTLLLFFWLLNVLDILIPCFSGVSQIFIYLASLTLFFVMVYKVLKRTEAS